MKNSLCISTSGLFLSSLRYIDKRLEPFKKSGAVTTKTSNHDGRNCLYIAFNAFKGGLSARNRQTDANAPHEIASHIIDAIADIVITDCKFHYIESSLHLPIDNEFNRHAFIRALTGFDRATDKSIAKSLINLTPTFLLDSFYTFSLDTLKVRWQEVCVLANDNACFLVCDGTFRELLRFLISNLESSCTEVHLFGRDGGVEVLTRALKPVNVYVNDELSADAQVVSKLIAIAPKRIFLHSPPKTHTNGHCEERSDEAIQPRVFDFIQNLFGSCVQVVQS